MPSRTGECLTQVVAEGLRVSGRAHCEFDDLVRGARGAISAAVVNGHDIDAMWRESDPDKRLPGRYRRHQVVTDDEFGFTVVVLLWEPGAVTPIHDHDTWCVFGVLEGSLEVTNYTILEDPGEGPLVLAEMDRGKLATGTLGDNRLQEQHEIHRVRNIGAQRAMSLHVYGRDLTRRMPFEGRSVRVRGKSACLAFQDQPAY